MVDLSHAVDVYSEWIDACDEIANPKSAKSTATRRDPARGSQSQSQPRQASYPRDEAEKGGATADVGDVSDLDFDDEDDNDDDMRLTRGGEGDSGGGRRLAVLSDDEDEDDY